MAVTLCSRFLRFHNLCFFFIITIGLRRAHAQPSFTARVCLNRGNYTANSTYKANLDHLLSTFVTNNPNNYGFYNSSYGQNSDTVNAIGLCRGDITPDACRRCLNDAITVLTNICSLTKEAIGWYETCMLRYSNRSLIGVVEESPYFNMSNSLGVSDKNRFNRVVRSLLDNLTSAAAAGDSRLKFAARNISASNFPTVYGLVQCTPDLSEVQCRNCLTDALSILEDCCGGMQGGRVVLPSCNFRYESYPFFESIAPPLSPSSSPPLPSNRTVNAEGNKSNTSRMVVIIVVSIVVVVVVITIVSMCIYLRARKAKINRAKSAPEAEITDVESLQHDFDIIKEATDNFSDAKKLGKGGFGAVYKGRLSSGQDIAVKRLSQASSQGDDEFKNEVMLVAKLQHRNLVRLLGFSLKENERLLIYEFVQNSSLDKFIFDPVKRADLDWGRRYKIIEGITRGLVYLHEDSRLRIIHRDLKASNILLDEEMNVKISDFGTARLFVRDQEQGDTSRIVGTYGYMAPEYAMRGHFSVKSDVFSFGVLILEIVSGQRNNCFRDEEKEMDFISTAWKNWRDGTTINVIDPYLRGGPMSEITRCIHIGLLCVQERLADRPTMTSVLLMLNSPSLALPTPSQPTFFMSNFYSGRSSTLKPNSQVAERESDQSKGYSTQESSYTDLITELYPR